jgi:hypothetical protein
MCWVELAGSEYEVASPWSFLPPGRVRLRAGCSPPSVSLHGRCIRHNTTLFSSKCRTMESSPRPIG